MSDVATSYFNNLFQAENGCNTFMPIINNISHCISVYDNDSLLNSFYLEEFHVTLFAMNFDKSSSRDGLKLTFYKNVLAPMW